MVNLGAERDSSLTFGPFCLRPRRRQLEKEHRELKIGSRALDLLVVLTERPGQVFDQRELIQRVWPDTAIEESALRVQIAGLRRVLGDCRRSAQYVATVPGRGYCFVAEVRRADERLLSHSRATSAAIGASDRELEALISPALGLLFERSAAEDEVAPLTACDLPAIEQLCRRLEHLVCVLRSAASRFAVGR